MDFHWVWKAIAIVTIGTLILRTSGRKSISQLTVPQTIIMISIGTLMIQPVSERNIWITFLIALVLVLTLIILEFMQTRIDLLENLLTGKAVMVIQNGQIDFDMLYRLRLTADQLEMRIRQAGILRVEDIKWATIEPSGQLGYELVEQERPASKADVQAVLDYVQSCIPDAPIPPQVTMNAPPDTLFTEVRDRAHSGPPARRRD